MNSDSESDWDSMSEAPPNPTILPGNNHVGTNGAKQNGVHQNGVRQNGRPHHDQNGQLRQENTSVVHSKNKTTRTDNIENA